MRYWLSTLLKDNPSIVGRLIFSLTAYAATKDADVYQDFIEFAHNQGARVLIKRFEIQSMSAQLNKNLRPDFIRLSREIGRNIAGDPAKQDFVHTLVAMGRLLDITIFAKNVIAEHDLNTLKEIGIAGASR